MNLPELTENSVSKEMTEEFLGYNANFRNSDGEWQDEKNMTCDYYPLASTRQKRQIMQTTVKSPNGQSEDKTKQRYFNGKVLGAAFTDGQLIELVNETDNESKIEGCWFKNNNTAVGKKTEYVSYESYCSGQTVEFMQMWNEICVKNIEYDKDNNQSTVTIYTTAFSKATKSNWIKNGKINRYHKTFEDDEKEALKNPRIFVWRYCYSTKKSFKKELSIVDNTMTFNNDYTFTFTMVGKASTYFHSRKDTQYIPVGIMMDNYYTCGIIDTDFSAFGANDNQRTLVRQGSNIICFPDGVVYETNSDEDKPIYSIKKELTLFAGDTPTKAFVARTFLADSGYKLGYKRLVLENGFWSNKSTNPTGDNDSKYRVSNAKVQQWIDDSNMWVDVDTYVGIYPNSSSNITDIFSGYNVGDAIDFDYLYKDSNGNLVKDEAIYSGKILWNSETQQYNTISGTIIAKGTVDNTGDKRPVIIISAGYVRGDYTTKDGEFVKTDTKKTPFVYLRGNIQITRKMPKIAYACESQNRVWGCSDDGHEIYASMLGNPYSWYNYSGISTDSYAVNVGTDGEFTGCVNYLGYPLFFKENSMHYISGSYPTNSGEIDSGSYAVTTTTDFLGVEKGSDKSLVIINSVLYYKSPAGIVAYDGVSTTVISDALGKTKYKNAIAGAQNGKYYVCMQNCDDDTWCTFCYDTTLGVWTKEDNERFYGKLNIGNQFLYYTYDEGTYDEETGDEKVTFAQTTYKAVEQNELQIDGTSNNITNVEGASNNITNVEGDFDWFVQTASYGYSYPNNKYLSRFQIRLQLEKGASASFFIQYNSDGVWHRCGEMHSTKTKTFLLPIRPMRCDHASIKIAGTGECKIFSIAKLFEEGGDV